MSTSALIRIQSKQPFVLVVSRDGNPDFILKVLASIQLPLVEITGDLFKAAYVRESGMDARPDTFSDLPWVAGQLNFQNEPVYSRCVQWMYDIDKDGCMRFYCNNPHITKKYSHEWYNKNEDPNYPITPLLYLHVVRVECKEEVMRSILTSLVTLACHKLELTI